MSVTVTNISLERFKGSVGFTANYACTWGNIRKAKIEKVKLEHEGADGEEDGTETVASAAQEKKAKARMQLKKQLIVSKEYEAIKSFQNALRAWVYKHSVPSFFKEGFQLVKVSGVEHIERRMKQAVGILPAPSDKNGNPIPQLPELIEAFIRAYPAQVREARSVLEPVGQFNADDYPDAESLREAFSISWNWIAFTVPEGLPPELRQAEEEKMQRNFADASDQITQALRAGFHELIAHAVDKLQPGEDGKPKKIFDSMTGNILDFLETFQNRNITNDIELAALVEKAKAVLVNVTPQKLRDMASVRANTLAKFGELKTQLDGMITVKPSRKFDFSQDEPAETPAPTAETEAAQVADPQQPQLV